MNAKQIKQYLEQHSDKSSRTIVIVDFANVAKWEESLGWPVSVAGLSKLVKHLSKGAKYLRRFYYGADYGPNQKSTTLIPWSAKILSTADAYGFEVIQKSVKYIHDSGEYKRKCDLDVEMVVDLIKERDNYDTAIIFSGDGDLAYAIQYLHENFGKEFYVFGARGHVGREIIDAKNSGHILDIFYAEDFESRISLHN